ncbi:nucleotide pyrophosphohydrolase MazG [Neoasaia chiangmaiensis NBRC 101099]|uniref:Nucleoside triphosphate pyrophosphohydrolase n=1 Tax=Neoasaia chiangmaiensis TaxID=320497 RepID=A0A1U9KS70_9PROT|nr:nucleoside triphosphate pyrophosphohydrolase [Neoasaia chiangmaiensis]AQS88625.1 nucleoside triphosphate hydrolase [Neoasaia chiangmaiensis]GBR36045.1 nucleotide pyrophosphohydrolase MazG [Neoasaia chiangmaiensis NBRC 101099]GEN15489.1 nucleoside triphosphate pyrophosphohydrolase [Neoasaia chiangmaiensis]
MTDSNSSAARELDRLLDVMARLRDPETGCPWDKVQTHATIAPYAIEEAYEVMDAIAQQDWVALPDELGDLLLQVVYQARIGEEDGRFDFATVAKSIADKMIRRHPHVFGDATLDADLWERNKAQERAGRAEYGALAGIPRHLPALTRAGKLSARAARVGFDWGTAVEALDKIGEELAEVKAELDVADADRLEDEIGDVLFTVANLARKLKLDPEACLRRANDKFARRFNDMEALLAQRGEALADQDLNTLENLWQDVKRRHRTADSR